MPPQAPLPAKSNTTKIILIVLGVILFVLFLVCAGLVALLLPPFPPRAKRLELPHMPTA